MAKPTLTTRVSELEREVTTLLMVVSGLLVARDRKRVSPELVAAVVAWSENPDDSDARRSALEALHVALGDK